MFTQISGKEIADSSDAMGEQAELAEAKPRRWFFGAAILLMIGAIVAACFQKNDEAMVSIFVSKSAAVGGKTADVYKAESVQARILAAERWQALSLAAACLAAASSGVALWRREKFRGIWVVLTILLVVYIALELIMF